MFIIGYSSANKQMKTAYTVYKLPESILQDTRLWKEMVDGNASTTCKFSLPELFGIQTETAPGLVDPALVIRFDQLSVTLAVDLAVNRTLASTTLMVPPGSVDGAKVLVDLAYREVIVTAAKNLERVIDLLFAVRAATLDEVGDHDCT